MQAQQEQGIKVEEKDEPKGRQQGRTGSWTDEEHLKYVVFIDFFSKELNSKERRRYSNADDSGTTKFSK